MRVCVNIQVPLKQPASQPTMQNISYSFSDLTSLFPSFFPPLVIFFPIVLYKTTSSCYSVLVLSALMLRHEATNVRTIQRNKQNLILIVRHFCGQDFPFFFWPTICYLPCITLIGVYYTKSRVSVSFETLGGVSSKWGLCYGFGVLRAGLLSWDLCIYSCIYIYIILFHKQRLKKQKIKKTKIHI